MTRWRHSLRARLTLWYGGVLAALMLAVAALALLVIRRATGDRIDGFLAETAHAFRRELAAEYQAAGTLDKAVRQALDDFQFRDARVAVFRLDAAGPQWLGLTPTQGTLAAREEEEARPGLDSTRLRAAVAARTGAAGSPFSVDDAEGGFRVQLEAEQLAGERLLVAVAQPLHDQRETLEAVATTLALVLPMLLALAVLGGVFLAGRGLAPLAAMGRRAAEISASNLHDRLPVADPRDELGGLGLVINGLLGRLEGAFERQRRFMADASHELRTPVTIVRNEAEVTLAREGRPEAEYREALGVIGGESRRLTRIVEDLFLLARADAGSAPLHPVELYLDELVEDVAHAMRTVAQAHGVHVDVRPAGEMPYRGDEDLLRRALRNLLENAIRHSPASDTVQVQLEGRPDGYVVRVRDEGPGVPEDARPRIFERFFRADAAPTRPGDDGGTGLGLPIARWVAEAHGGTLELEPSSGAGTTFRLALPRANRT